MIIRYTRDLAVTLVSQAHQRELDGKFAGKKTLAIPFQWLNDLNGCNFASLPLSINSMDSYRLCSVDFNYMPCESAVAAVRLGSGMTVFLIKQPPA